VYNLLYFSVTELYNHHHHNHFYNIFISPKRNFIFISVIGVLGQKPWLWESQRASLNLGSPYATQRNEQWGQPEKGALVIVVTLAGTVEEV
jgi:hypothetical protein